MLGTARDLEDWEIELALREAEGVGEGGFVDDYPDPELAAQLVAIELNVQQWMKEGQEELGVTLRHQFESGLSGNHTHAFAEALREQFIRGSLATLNTLADVLAHLTEDGPIAGPTFMRDATSQEHVRQEAVRMVARLNDMILERQKQAGERRGASAS